LNPDLELNPDPELNLELDPIPNQVFFPTEKYKGGISRLTTSVLNLMKWIEASLRTKIGEAGQLMCLILRIPDQNPDPKSTQEPNPDQKKSSGIHSTAGNTE
jgi:hypothetical protein